MVKMMSRIGLPECGPAAFFIEKSIW